MTIVTHGPTELTEIAPLGSTDLTGQTCVWKGKTKEGKCVLISYENKNLIGMISIEATDEIPTATGHIFFHQVLTYDSIDLPLLKKITRRRITFPA